MLPQWKIGPAIYAAIIGPDRLDGFRPHRVMLDIGERARLWVRRSLPEVYITACTSKGRIGASSAEGGLIDADRVAQGGDG